MALSRIALAAALASAASPAAAQPDAAPDALAVQREIVRAAVSDDCGGGDEDEIVVCGRRAEEALSRRYRVEPTPGDPLGSSGRAGGAQHQALRAATDRCAPVGPHQTCGGTIPILAIVGALARAAIDAHRNRD